MLFRPFLVFMFLIVAMASFSCSSQKNNAISEQTTARHNLGEPWFDGTIAEAQKLASVQKQPLFVYWGATWCPPCNEIKSQVLMREEFKEMMSGIICVYLDGDDDEAQVWAEKLKANGYPTLLLLSPEGEEWLRISEVINLTEFKSALSEVMQKQDSFKLVLQRALESKATPSDWRILAYFSWNNAPELRQNEIETLTTLKKLAEMVPPELAAERAQLNAQLLEFVTNIDPKDMKAIHKDIKRHANRYLTAMFVDEQAVWASRATLAYSAGRVMGWAYSGKQNKNRQLAMNKWLTALERIRSNEQVSIDVKVWSVFPEVEFYRLSHGERATLPDELINRVRDAVKAADSSATTNYERQSVISGAAYMLREIKSYEEAEELLLKEVKVSASPYYYYSSLANLAKVQNKKADALKYSAKARESAKGAATKLQWIANDIELTIKLQPAARRGEQDQLRDLLDEYLRTLMRVGDGFSGRNLNSNRVVLKNIKSLSTTRRQMLMPVVAKYNKQCDQLKVDEQKQRCDKFLKSI